MRTEFSRIMFSVVTVGVLSATAFRVATAPDRVQEQRAVARAVCVEGGGQWVGEGREAQCVKPERTSSKG